MIILREKTCWQHWLILLGAGFLFLMAGNGRFNLTNPDEIFYVQTTHEMAEQHNWVTPYLFGASGFVGGFFIERPTGPCLGHRNERGYRS
jgi:4-amino-4-deoxy-L-arabinose transferase-like glycosyltransferase